MSKRVPYPVKYVTAKALRSAGIGLRQYPNAGPHPHVGGMRSKFYGWNAPLVRNGAYVYHVPVDVYLDKLWDKYFAQVYEYCKEQFEEYVKPYCIEHGVEFIGGGAWGWKLGDFVGGSHYEQAYQGKNPVDEYHPLDKVLREPVPGMPLNDVGSLMPDYRKEACDHEEGS